LLSGPDGVDPYDALVPDLLASLVAPIAGAASALAGGVTPDVALERPADATHGDYATAVALRLAPVLKRGPREIAEEIAQRLRSSDDFAAVEVAGPGFVNLRLAGAWYRRAVAGILAAGDRYGAGSPARPQEILVELISANPTGRVTVASARNGAYGDAVGRLYTFAGHHVTREYYFNDAGRQIDLFGESVRARRRGEEPPEDGYPGPEVAELAERIDLDPDASVEAWRDAAVPLMLEEIRASVERLRIDIDIWFSERDLHASGAVERAIARARAMGHVYEQDGATWLATSQFGDDKDRVLVRGDGTPTYFAADLAYIEHKFSRGHGRLMYVLGPDHHGYIGRLKAAAACLGHDPAAVDVQIYQTVTVSGARMGKRRGNVVTADELMDGIGVDATRFFLVQRSHDQPMDIDLDVAVAQNNENPVYYVQYAHARAASILRKAGPAESGPWNYEPVPQEAAIVKRLAEWPSVGAEAAAQRAPHRVVAWLGALAGDWHRYHHDGKHDPSLRVIADDPDARGFRLALTACVATTIRTALGLIGVDAPDEM
jgi:arginyl-tRNA synthetase